MGQSLAHAAPPRVPARLPRASPRSGRGGYEHPCLSPCPAALSRGTRGQSRGEGRFLQTPSFSRPRGGCRRSFPAANSQCLPCHQPHNYREVKVSQTPSLPRRARFGCPGWLTGAAPPSPHQGRELNHRAGRPFFAFLCFAFFCFVLFPSTTTKYSAGRANSSRCCSVALLFPVGREAPPDTTTTPTSGKGEPARLVHPSGSGEPGLPLPPLAGAGT